MYAACGWPDDFDKNMFKENLETLRAKLRDPDWTLPEDAEEIGFFSVDNGVNADWIQ
ncbi:hypothetical protein BDV96DRAFT_587637 [Lophiotrema nucula]|uniref:Uncharacterized protein n=1 Tax=Lophiotrema nucula TaxID=690887 RepID=A0A6A5YN13_9PLEO|nr:hypothetical protein BDV96DRAFT_587637 [Lophiotrema nucula]